MTRCFNCGKDIRSLHPVYAYQRADERGFELLGENGRPVDPPFMDACAECAGKVKAALLANPGPEFRGVHPRAKELLTNYEGQPGLDPHA